jgi:transposase
MNIKSNNYSLDLKLRIINTYNKKIYSIPNLATLFSVSKSSIYNWIKLYTNNNLLSKTKFIKITSKFQNPQIRSIILNFITLNSNFIYTDLITTVYNTLNIIINKSTLYNIIHDLNLSKKSCKI